MSEFSPMERNKSFVYTRVRSSVYLQVRTICSNAREADSADVDKLAKTIADVPIIIGMAGPPKTVMKATVARAPNRMSTTGT